MCNERHGVLLAVVFPSSLSLPLASIRFVGTGTLIASLPDKLTWR